MLFCKFSIQIKLQDFKLGFTKK